MMCRFRIHLVLAVALLSVGCPQTVEIVQFRDIGLEAIIRGLIIKPTGDILPSDLLGITTLDAHGLIPPIYDISGLEFCVDLRVLDLSDNEITSLAPLSALTKLQTLDVSNNAVENFDALSSLAKLQYLYASNNAIENIDSLKQLNGLLSVALDSNPIRDIDISAIGGELQNLSQITIGQNEIEHLQLDNLPALSSLVLEQGQIQSITLTNTPKLAQLNLKGNRIVSFTLSGSHSLHSLKLDENFIENLSLSDLPLLEELEVSDNRLSLIDLRALTGLTRLYINDNSFETLDNILGIERLTSLYAAGNSINDVSALAGLGIYRLDLQNNDITSIAALEFFTHASYDAKIELNKNRIGDISPLAGKAWGWVNLEENIVADLRPLTNETTTVFWRLVLRQNPLSQDSLCIDIPILESHNPNLDVTNIVYDGKCES